MNVHQIPKVKEAPRVAKPPREPLFVPNLERVQAVDITPKWEEPIYTREPPPKPESWRFSQMDLEDFEKLAAPLLVQRFPQAKAEEIVGWARGFTAGARKLDLLFVRSANAFGLFSLNRSPWYPDGFIDEQWSVFAKDGRDNLDLLYREAVQWGISLGVKDFRFHRKARLKT